MPQIPLQNARSRRSIQEDKDFGKPLPGLKKRPKTERVPECPGGHQKQITEPCGLEHWE